MPLRAEFYPLLADPSPASWRAIIKLLDALGTGEQQRAVDVLILGDELRAWPPEVARPAPAAWVANPRLYRLELALCQSVREVDLYREYIDAAAGAPALRLRDGAPAVRLERQFTGALQGGAGRMHRVGKKGQADLAGSLCVEWLWTSPTMRPFLSHNLPDAVPCAGCRKVVATNDTGGLSCLVHGTRWHRLAVAIAVEVKTAVGAMDATQATRQDALRRRGEVSLCVKTTAEMVRALVEARDNVLKMLGVTT